MRDPARIDVMLAKLGELWKRSPDLRLGQLVEVLAHEAVRGTGYSADTFQLEDDEMLAAIEKQLARPDAPQWLATLFWNLREAVKFHSAITVGGWTKDEYMHRFGWMRELVAARAVTPTKEPTDA